jgi:hypothetical protein
MSKTATVNNIPSLRTRLRESVVGERLFGTPKVDPKNKQTKVMVLGAVEQSYGIYQVPTFKEQVDCLWNDPLIKEAVTMFAEQVVSTGFFLTGNPKYQVKLGPKNQTALEIIREWCRLNQIDIKVLEIVIEMKAFGNSFWKMDDYGFSKIPIESAWHMVREKANKPLQEIYALQLTPLYNSRVIPNNEFVHFRVGITGYHAPLGQGVIYSLLAKPTDSKGNVAPSIYDVRLNMRKSLDQGFQNFSFGNVWIGVPNMSNEDFEAEDEDGKTISDKVANMAPTGNRVITNTDVKVELEVPERTQSYDEFIKNERDEFFMALADPSLKMGLEQGFTKATAVTGSDIYKYKVSSMRRSVKQKFEDIFQELLNDLGYDGYEADIQMNFGPEETAEYLIADIFTAVDKKIISRKTSVRLLCKYHKWDIDETNEAEIKEEEAEDMAKLEQTTEIAAKAKTPLMSKGKDKDANKKPTPPKKATESAFNPAITLAEMHEGIAGYNQDMSRVYVDKKLPEKYYALAIAEKEYEFSLLNAGVGYDKAHTAAINYAKQIAQELQLSWTQYNEDLIILLAEIKARNSTGPTDLYKVGNN